MNEPTIELPYATTTVATDDQGRLIEDVGCRQCGYNLRSLEAAGVCPECGAAVSISIHGYYLRFAPLAWVQRLALGAKLLIVAIVTGFVGWLTVMGIGIAVAVTTATATATATSPSQAVLAAGPSATFEAIMTVAMIGLSVVCSGLVIAGIIFLTARDPAEVGKPERFGSRRLARWCLWPIPVALAGSFIMSGLQNSAVVASLNPLVIALGIVIGIASVASYVIMPAAMLRRFMGLMKRIPRSGLVTFAKIEFWAYLVVTGLGISMYVIAIVMLFTFAPALRAATAATPTTAPNPALTRLSQMGYVGGATSAPVVTSGPAGSGAMTITYPTGQQVVVGNPVLTTMPASGPFVPPAAAMTWGLIAAAAGAIGGCGSFAVAIAGLVFLIMAWRALAKAALEAAGHTTAVAVEPPPA